ncbi:hypothetical protein QE450_000844 [Paenibacillus sp. SORGH_AS306]|uniref:phage head-tail adapter protein n=1 Tax=unclassified Paenibacillus TaxID=185978 RepID=UPI00278958D0|nr:MULTISPECIES: phage head-tail adapter protein [unclassified Paenibacillus]MDQ1233346.1 hypothetical protein [Paenibacillus sp. SORGH_AS_0306]MDR6110387.1 hypothetical protein [Paenibacillus sp. SORGH_AS_0338]
MLFRDELKLITFPVMTDEIGNELPGSPVERLVFTNKVSIQRNEFYQAALTEFRPEISFQIRTIEYGGEKWIRHEEIDYKLIRTYSKNQEITELVCERADRQ